MEGAGGGSVVWILVDVGFVLAAVWLLSNEGAPGNGGSEGAAPGKAREGKKE